MNDDGLVGDVVIPKVRSSRDNSNLQNNEDLLPLGYEALPRSASTVRRRRISKSVFSPSII